jgi:mannose-1-phosphate guanylyltransferase
VATAETILKEINAHLPELDKGLSRLAPVLGTPSFARELKAVYNGISGISFDYGVMERTEERIYVLPCDCGWSDVGSWASLYELRSAERDANQNLEEGDALLIDCEQSFVSSAGGRLVTCLGLDGCLVVDTPDALLVADLTHSQDVRKIVDALKARGKQGVL